MMAKPGIEVMRVSAGCYTCVSRTDGIAVASSGVSEAASEVVVSSTPCKEMNGDISLIFLRRSVDFFCGFSRVRNQSTRKKSPGIKVMPITARYPANAFGDGLSCVMKPTKSPIERGRNAIAKANALEGVDSSDLSASLSKSLSKTSRIRAPLIGAICTALTADFF